MFATDCGVVVIDAAAIAASTATMPQTPPSTVALLRRCYGDEGRFRSPDGSGRFGKTRTTRRRARSIGYRAIVISLYACLTMDVRSNVLRST